jgi:hypothetical protein
MIRLPVGQPKKDCGVLNPHLFIGYGHPDFDDRLELKILQCKRAKCGLFSDHGIYLCYHGFDTAKPLRWITNCPNWKKIPLSDR